MDSPERVSIGSSLGDGWESYPTRLGENVPLGCDTENVRARLERDKGRIFSPLEECLELWFAPERNRTGPGHVGKLIFILLRKENTTHRQLHVLWLTKVVLEKHAIQDVTVLKNLWQVSCPVGI